MKTHDFYYSLPAKMIAQEPIEPRHNSRLMVLDRNLPDQKHANFKDLKQFLDPGDLLVINQTRVIPARIFGYKSTGGRIELLLLKKLDSQTWEVLGGGKRLVEGARINLEGGEYQAIIKEVLTGSRRIVEFDSPIESYLFRHGQMPLPPYIHTPLQNPERYQTVFSNETGSVAAPTAGLHFTSEMMEDLIQFGIKFVKITLHVGLDTFSPVTEENIEEHIIHSEWCKVDTTAADAINKAKKAGKRIVAVGTTSARTLETCAIKGSLDPFIQPFEGLTDLFIVPGYQFKIVDAMITNFHLPFSTLLMMVSAFAGKERILDAYNEAIHLNYRFYSFGDAMLIL